MILRVIVNECRVSLFFVAFLFPQHHDAARRQSYAKLAEKKWKHSFSIRIFYPRKTIHLFISRHILLVFKKKRMNGLEAKPFTNRSFLHKSRGVLQNAPTPFGAMCYDFPYWARAGAAISAAFKFAGFTFFFPRSYFFLSAWYFLLSYKRFLLQTL